MRRIVLALIGSIVFPVSAQTMKAPPRAVSGPSVMSTSTSSVLYRLHIDAAGASVASGFAYFFPKEAPPDCKWGAIYINLSGDGGRAAYATALSAFRSGAELSGVAYTVEVNGICMATDVTG
jgi:hypothetical protein